MDTLTEVQIQDDRFCISYYTDTHGKCFNPTILLPGMGK